MENSKISIRAGGFEVTFEGSEKFISESLLPVVEQFVQLDLPDIAAQEDVLPTSGGAAPQQIAQQGHKLSVTDFAVKMGAKSGSDLVMAAVAYLHHTKGMETFRRSEILGAMKEAKSFYKASYGSNLSKSLDMLTKSSRLQTPSSDVYALPYPEVEATKRFLS